MGSHQDNISEVLADGVCTGCGTCAAVCEASAIQMRLNNRRGTFEPVVQADRCTNCGLCRSCCPPVTWSNRRTTQSWHPCVGDYLNVFAVYSTDKQVRHQSASGGFITSLLLYLLRNKVITGAVVTRRRTDNPFLGQAFLATREEEILAAKGSKYVPIPFDEILRTLLHLDVSQHRIAFVGLPCHIEGVSKASEHFTNLQHLIKFKIGIVCGRAPSVASYDYILKRLKISKSDVKQISNRGDGWPGFMTITLKNKETKKIHYTDNLACGMVLSSPLFTPLGCELCADPGGFSADVITCDAWLERFCNDHEGINLVLVKSQDMADILNRMEQKGQLVLLESSLCEFLKANHSVMTQKLVNKQVALVLLVGRRAYNYSREIIYRKKPSLCRKLRLLVFYLHILLLRRINLTASVFFLNFPVLFYLKAAKLLKK
ncbi:MAG: Coenzyme F420 hydrogenase/dehydrogenase, beta subunit C-terminal domain [Sedimentisphaerales bacterium]